MPGASTNDDNGHVGNVPTECSLYVCIKARASAPEEAKKERQRERERRIAERETQITKEAFEEPEG